MTHRTAELAAYVRLHDYERYLCSLFAPAAMRPQLWATQAIAQELFRIPVIASEAMVGMVRLKWWQEEIFTHYAGTATAPPDHPTLAMVAPLLPHGRVDADAYAALCDALAEQIAAPQEFAHVRTSVRQLYYMLGVSVGETREDMLTHYQAMGEIYAHIAAIRRFSHVGRNSEQRGLMASLPTLMPPLPPHSSRYLRALHRLNGLWLRAIHRAARENAPLPHTIPLLALRLLVR
jgi:NADH dehydrogenase [ubiquinone] 1 alpha subcomplex assembly factor 6